MDLGAANPEPRTPTPPVANAPERGPARSWGVLRSPAVLAVLVILVGTAGIVAGVRAAGGPEALALRMGPAAPYLAVPVLALISATPFPSELFVIPLSGIWGFHWGAWMTWLSWLGASFIQYFVARRASRDLALGELDARLPRWLRRFPVSHPVFLICGRWVPWGPHMVNTAAGLARVDLVRYSWCAVAGITPQAVFISAVGNAVF